MKRYKLLFSVLLILAVMLAACGGNNAVQNNEENMPEPVVNDPAPEPVVEDEPVVEMPMYPTDGLAGTEISFWHAMSSGSNLEGVEALTAKFNETNEWGITVVQISQGRQGDLETALNGGIATGELPNLTQGFPNALSKGYNLDVFSDIAPYVSDPDVGLSEAVFNGLYENLYAAGTLPDGSQLGIPMHQSAMVLIYNHTWGQELGFENPPTTSAELKEQACAASVANNADDDEANDDTGGLVYYPDASFVSPMIWAFDGDYTNDTDDGYDFTNPGVYDAAVFLKDLIDEGCTLSTPSYPNPEFAARQALFYGSSTAGFKYQGYDMADAENEDVWGAIPFPGPNGTLTVDSLGQMLAIVTTNPDQDLASWLFIKWLTSPEIQAEWISYTSYFPSQDGVDLGSRTTDDIIYGEALELLAKGSSEPNYPAHGAVRSEIRSAFYEVAEAEDGAAIQAILDALNDEAADLVSETE